jgi:glycopeptide antibiotics resistance protein
MLYLLFFQRIGRQFSGTYAEYLRSSVNLIPLRTILEFAEDVRDNTPYFALALCNLAGNIILFIPLGVFLPMLWDGQRRFFRFLLTAGLTVTAVETMQLFTMLGSCDIDDLIFNLLGASMGYGLRAAGSRIMAKAGSPRR